MSFSDGVAVAALVVALGVGVAHYLLQKRVAADQHALQSRLAAIEEERRSEELASRSSASVECRKEQQPTASGHVANWLVFQNTGQVEATDVWFEAESLEWLIPSNVSHEHPLLAPGQEWTVLADPNIGDPERAVFRYGWTDARGSHERQFVLDVFS